MLSDSFHCTLFSEYFSYTLLSESFLSWSLGSFDVLLLDCYWYLSLLLYWEPYFIYSLLQCFIIHCISFLKSVLHTLSGNVNLYPSVSFLLLSLDVLCVLLIFWLVLLLVPDNNAFPILIAFFQCFIMVTEN